MFPDLEIITELTYPANMRFLGIHYSQNAPKYLTFRQKKALEATPQDQDLFRPAFVSGSAISTSMLDTLLYQSYVKPYIISVIYLLIGLKQHAGSGTLIFVRFHVICLTSLIKSWFVFVPQNLFLDFFDNQISSVNLFTISWHFLFKWLTSVISFGLLQSLTLVYF